MFWKILRHPALSLVALAAAFSPLIFHFSTPVLLLGGLVALAYLGLNLIGFIRSGEYARIVEAGFGLPVVYATPILLAGLAGIPLFQFGLVFAIGSQNPFAAFTAVIGAVLTAVSFLAVRAARRARRAGTPLAV